MFNVTPIGSCRITTPLRRGQLKHGIHLNLDRCYGYCHSPAEALQMARFMRGEVTIPSDVWPLVSRSHSLDVISASQHTPSDLYVVELASAKEVTIDGVSIQLNYLNSVYADFFSDTGRARAFWNVADDETDTEKSAFLAEEWSETEDQRAQSETLGKIRLRLVSRENLRNSMEDIVSILPNVLFVSHVDACKTDGNPIKSRSEFIKLVREEARDAGLNFYDPTEVMTEFGQTAAIEDESTSLAHFTDEFGDAIMDDWMRSFIAPCTDAMVRSGVSGAVERKLQPQISAAIHHHQFADTQTRLGALARHFDGFKPLLVDLEHSQRQAQKTFIADAPAQANTNETAELVLKASTLGLFETALSTAVQAPDGLSSMSVHTLLRVADQAFANGDRYNAFEFYLAAVCHDQHCARAAKALAALALAEKIDLLSDLTAEKTAEVLALLDPVQKLELLRLNGAPVTASITSQTAAQEVAEIATYLAEQNGIGQAAELLAFWRDEQQKDRITDPTLMPILDGWLETALAEKQPLQRIHGINAVLHASPRHAGARNAMRDERKHLALRVREAGKDRDIATLDALSVEGAALSKPVPELDLWRARVRFELGDYQTAIALGQSAAVLLPETISVWVLLMRAAQKAGDPVKATEFAQRVVSLSSPETSKLRVEAERVLRAHLEGA